MNMLDDCECNIRKQEYKNLDEYQRLKDTLERMWQVKRSRGRSGSDGGSGLWHPNRNNGFSRSQENDLIWILKRVIIRTAQYWSSSSQDQRLTEEDHPQTLVKRVNILVLWQFSVAISCWYQPDGSNKMCLFWDFQHQQLTVLDWLINIWRQPFVHVWIFFQIFV